MCIVKSFSLLGIEIIDSLKELSSVDFFILLYFPLIFRNNTLFVFHY